MLISIVSHNKMVDILFFVVMWLKSSWFRNLQEIYHSSINFDADSKSVLEIKEFPISMPLCGEGVSTDSTHKTWKKLN